MKGHGPMVKLPIAAGMTALAAVVGFGVARLSPSEREQISDRHAAVLEVKADSETKRAPETLTIPQNYLAAADIAVEQVGSGRVGSEILAPATVVAAPGSEAVIVVRASGAISKINRRLGDAVKAGEALALVNSMDAASMAAERGVTQAKADLARKTFDRESRLYDLGVTPKQDMEAAKAALVVAEAEVRRAATVARAAHVTESGDAVAVVSPISGRVTAQHAVLGAFVGPDTELFRVAADGAVQVEAAITAPDTRRISPGDQATIVPRSGSPVLATVRSVTPTVSAGSQSATAILIPNSATSNLVVGEGVQVRLRSSSSGEQETGTVPEDAIQSLDGRDVVFVRTADGFIARQVLVGVRSGGIAQVLKGVRAGESIATKNAFLLKAELRKKVGDGE